MKQASELVAILEREASEFARSTTAQTRMGIAVRLIGGQPGALVWSDWDVRAHLDSWTALGAQPVGLIRVSNAIATTGKFTVASSPFEEHASSPAAETDLYEMCRYWALHFRDELAWCGFTKIATIKGEPGSWEFEVGSRIQ
jgi:hypothetical protein